MPSLHRWLLNSVTSCLAQLNKRQEIKGSNRFYLPKHLHFPFPWIPHEKQALFKGREIASARGMTC